MHIIACIPTFVLETAMISLYQRLFYERIFRDIQQYIIRFEEYLRFPSDGGHSLSVESY